LAAGGFFAGAAVVAVLSAVAMSNAAAIAEVPGASTGLPSVRVAASAASPLAAAPVTQPATIVLPAPVPTTETVPAPEPAVLPAVTISRPAAARPAPVEPAAAEPAAAEPAAGAPAGQPAETSKHDKANKTSAEKSAAQTPAKAGNPSGHQLNEQSGLKRSRSLVPPDGD